MGGLVRVHDAGGNATAVADGMTVLAGPVADGAGLLAVHAATGRPGATAASPVATSSQVWRARWAVEQITASGT